MTIYQNVIFKSTSIELVNIDSNIPTLKRGSLPFLYSTCSIEQAVLMNITREKDLKGTEPCTWRHFPSLYIIQTWTSNIESQLMNLTKKYYIYIYSIVIRFLWLNEF